MKNELVVLNINDLRALFDGKATATAFADGRPVTLQLSLDIDRNIIAGCRVILGSSASGGPLAEEG